MNDSKISQTKIVTGELKIDDFVNEKHDKNGLAISLGLVAIKKTNIKGSQNHLQHNITTLQYFHKALEKLSKVSSEYDCTCFMIPNDKPLTTTDFKRLLSEIIVTYSYVKGNAALIKKLIDIGIDPSAQDSMSFINAVQCNDYNLANLLLDDSRINPMAMNGAALKTICQYNHIKVFRCVIKDTRVRKHAKDFLLHAVDYSCLTILRELLEDKELKFSKEDIFDALEKAVKNNELCAVDILLATRNVDIEKGIKLYNTLKSSRKLEGLLTLKLFRNDKIIDWVKLSSEQEK